MNKVTLKNAQDLAKKNNGECLSDVYKNTKLKLKWKCKEGHIWLSSYENIKAGRWCPTCAINKTKSSIDEVRIAGNKLGFTLLSKEYINNKALLKWSCGNHHIVYLGYCRIQEGYSCSKCKLEKTRLNNMLLARKKAKENNGKCLSRVYKNSNSKLKWKCEKGHVWSARYDHVISGTWCPICGAGTSERRLQAILEKIFVSPEFNIKSRYTGFSFLKNKKTKGIQHLDFVIFRNETPIAAVEYDGEQHFFPVNFGGISDKRAKAKFADTKRRDKRKNNIMRRNKAIVPIFLRVSYKEKLTFENIKQLLIKKKITALK